MEDIESLKRMANFLGLQTESPTLDFLNRIVTIHLERIPYESLSKILFSERKPYFPTLHEYVDRMHQYGFGGTCFANNFYFVELLNYLGFEAELNSVDGMDSHDSHVSCKVKIEGDFFIVDFGNMAHFSGPFPLTPGRVIEDLRGSNRFVFTPNMDGQTYKLEFFRNEKLIRRHLSKQGARRPEDFRRKIEESYRSSAYWMQIFCICKHAGNATLGIWNSTFFRQQGLEVKERTLGSADELKIALAEEMGLPKIPVEDILAKMKEYSGVAVF